MVIFGSKLSGRPGRASSLLPPTKMFLGDRAFKMFEFLNIIGLLNFRVFYIVILLLISLAGDNNKEMLWLNSDVQVDMGSTVLPTFISI